jgi:putative membrane protein
MDSVWTSAMASLGGVPQFLLYFLAALLLVVVFLFLYTLVTPQRDVALIRQGNTAAAISLGGALLGFAIPLSKSISQSHDLVDMVVWSTIALIVQLGVFGLSGLVVAHEGEKITKGDTATAAFLAFASIGAGLVSAAAMTYGP